MRSYKIRMGPNPIGLMPLKEKTNLDKDTDAQRGEERVDRDGDLA